MSIRRQRGFLKRQADAQRSLLDGSQQGTLRIATPYKVTAGRRGVLAAGGNADAGAHLHLTAEPAASVAAGATYNVSWSGQDAAHPAAGYATTALIFPFTAVPVVVAGYYDLDVAARFDVALNWSVEVTVTRGGTGTVVWPPTVIPQVAAFTDVVGTVHVPAVELMAGDTVTVSITNNSGGAGTVQAAHLALSLVDRSRGVVTDAPVFPARLAVGMANDPRYWVIDVATKTVETGWPTIASEVNGCDWSPDGSLLALSYGPTVIDVATKTAQTGWPALSGVQAVQFSPDGTRLAAAHSGGLTVIDVASKTAETGWPSLAAQGMGVGWSADGTKLAVAHNGTDKFMVIDVATKTAETGWPTYPNWYREDAQFNSPGSRLAVGGYAERTFEIIDVASKTVETGWPTYGALVSGVAFSVDDSRIAIAQSDAPQFAVVDVATKTQETGWPAPPSSGEGVAWSPDGARVAIAHQGADGLMVVDVATKAHDTTWPVWSGATSNPFRWVAWSP